MSIWDETPRAGPEHAGEIISLSWLWNALGILSEDLVEVAGRGVSGLPDPDN